MKNKNIKFEMIKQSEDGVIIKLDMNTYIKLISNCFIVSNNKFKNILYHADKINKRNETTMCIIINENNDIRPDKVIDLSGNDKLLKLE